MNLKHLLIITLVNIFTFLKIRKSSITPGAKSPGVINIISSQEERGSILLKKYILYKDIFKLFFYNISTHSNNNTKQGNKNNNNKPKKNNKLFLMRSSNNFGAQSNSKDV
jgi:hypothetical protein